MNLVHDKEACVACHTSNFWCAPLPSFCDTGECFSPVNRHSKTFLLSFKGLQWSNGHPKVPIESWYLSPHVLSSFQVFTEHCSGNLVFAQNFESSPCHGTDRWCQNVAGKNHVSGISNECSNIDLRALMVDDAFIVLLSQWPRAVVAWLVAL